MRARARRALVVFVHEHRSPEPPAPPWFGCHGEAVAAHLRPRARTCPPRSGRASWACTEPPDPGFFGAAHAWTAGHELSAVVGDEELTGGDFVRMMKQLIDLARQVANVAPSAATPRSPSAVGIVAGGLPWGIVAEGGPLSASTRKSTLQRVRGGS